MSNLTINKDDRETGCSSTTLLTKYLGKALIAFWKEFAPSEQNNGSAQKHGGAWIDYDATLMALGITAGTVMAFCLPENRGANLRLLKKAAAHTSKCFDVEIPARPQVEDIVQALDGTHGGNGAHRNPAVAAECSAQALLAVIEQHKLKVDDDGNYQITVELMKEAQALDQNSAVAH